MHAGAITSANYLFLRRFGIGRNWKLRNKFAPLSRMRPFGTAINSASSRGLRHRRNCPAIQFRESCVARCNVIELPRCAHKRKGERERMSEVQCRLPKYICAPWTILMQHGWRICTVSRRDIKRAIGRRDGGNGEQTRNGEMRLSDSSRRYIAVVPISTIAKRRCLYVSSCCL